MNGYRHHSIQLSTLFQDRIRDVQASCSRTHSKASRGQWVFWGRLGRALCKQPALPSHARLDLGLWLETHKTQAWKHFFFQVCLNTKALKWSQGSWYCMNWAEMTLRPKGKLKMPTPTQVLIRILSWDKERQQCVHHKSQKKKNSWTKKQACAFLIILIQKREGKK